MVYRTADDAGCGACAEHNARLTETRNGPQLRELCGLPQNIRRFVNCVHGKETPMEIGEDGREVLKIILAAYQSAGEGRKIMWPYEPPAYDKPIDLWKPELGNGA